MRIREQAAALLALWLGTFAGFAVFGLTAWVTAILPRDLRLLDTTVIQAAVVCASVMLPAYVLAGWMPASSMPRLAFGYQLAGVATAASIVAITTEVGNTADAGMGYRMAIIYLSIAPAAALAAARFKTHDAQTSGTSTLQPAQSATS